MLVFGVGLARTVLGHGSVRYWCPRIHGKPFDFDPTSLIRHTDAVAELTVDMIAGTPMEQEYRAKSPHPDRLQGLLDKLARFDHGFPGWTDDEIRGIAARR